MAKRNPKSKKKKPSGDKGPTGFRYPVAKNCRLGTLVGPTRFGSLSNQTKVGHSLDLLDLDAESPTLERILLTFFAHGFALDPKAPYKAALFEKKGPGGAWVDLRSKTHLRTIAPSPEHHFYGHGSFTKEGDMLLCVESHLSSGSGMISIRDPDTFATVDQFPTYGQSPHDCVLLENGKVLAVTNGGGTEESGALGNVSFIELRSQKLLEQLPIPVPFLNSGHLSLANRKNFAVVSAPRDGLAEEHSLGGICLRRGGEDLVFMNAPADLCQRLFGETLSVAVHPKTGLTAATNPHGDVVTFWDLPKLAHHSHLPLPAPRGVTFSRDGSLLIISYGFEGTLLFLDAQTLQEVPGMPAPTASFSGSHTYIWSPPAS